MGVALFDFDLTLVDVNSGHLWLRHEMRAGRVTWSQAAWAAWWFAKYRMGLGGGLEDAFHAAVQAYGGLPSDTLAGWSRQFFQAEVQPRLRPGARDALADHRARGDRIALASSTTQYLALEACEAWGLEMAAHTRLDVHEGVLTGRVASMALGPHKASRVREWAEAEGVHLADTTFYTDSATDEDLLALVGRPVCVNPDRRLMAIARARGWPIVDWGASAPAAG
jgi:HAD superfamily hydrolase (TIGR01490 family)